MRRAKMTAGSVVMEMQLRQTPTADAIWEAMPFESTASTWGDEVYFRTPVSQGAEPDATPLMQDGDIAYWPDGDAIAICFGPTPVSAPGEMRLISPGNVWATAIDNPETLRAVRDGDPVRIEAID